MFPRETAPGTGGPSQGSRYARLFRAGKGIVGLADRPEVTRRSASVLHAELAIGRPVEDASVDEARQVGHRIKSCPGPAQRARDRRVVPVDGRPRNVRGRGRATATDGVAPPSRRDRPSAPLDRCSSRACVGARAGATPLGEPGSTKRARGRRRRTWASSRPRATVPRSPATSEGSGIARCGPPRLPGPATFDGRTRLSDVRTVGVRDRGLGRAVPCSRSRGRSAPVRRG